MQKAAPRLHYWFPYNSFSKNSMKNEAPLIQLNLVEKLAIEAIVGRNMENNSMAYKKFSINKTVCHSCAYERMYRCNNSIVKTSAGTFMSIDNIECVQLITGPKMYIALG